MSKKYVALLLGKTEEIAQEIISSFGGLYQMKTLDAQMLERHPKITKIGAKRLEAAFHVGKASLYPNQSLETINCPDLVMSYVASQLIGKAEESCLVLFLNRRRKVISSRILSEGSEAYTIVDPRNIFHYAVQCRASGIILAHNHPSGDASPSEQDIQITKRIKKIGDLMGIPLLDHLIIGEYNHVSLAERGLLQ